MNRILSLSRLNWKLRWEEGLNEVGRMAQQFHWFWFLSLSPLHSSRPFGCLIKKKQIIPAYPVPAPFHRHRHRQSPCKHFAFAYGPVLSSALASLHSFAKCRIQFFHLIPPLSPRAELPNEKSITTMGLSQHQCFALYSRKCLKIHNKISQK